ncbi:carbohydrate ABC transporter permease [Tessaracoccus coleopterorum]|uniref:carbohydrate ABC transporter permease n=1 Tax=Tessaracoccus coleopterorum TaxID=2714950 RepID=UPI001E3ED38A|nr:sugar ABC transporter permease [Tessaracoccus coleopterorum]
MGGQRGSEHPRLRSALLLIFGLFSWLPIVRSVVMSFQKTNLVDPAVFVGLDNFAYVLNDPLLGIAVRNTVYFAFLALLIGFPIPLVVAVLMSEVRRFKGLYSALAYLPVVVPPVVSVLLWKFFYDASPTGVFNTILGWIGLGPFPWYQDAGWAMPSLVLAATWAGAGAPSSSTSRPSPASRQSCTRPPRWTARASGARSGMSPFLSCVASSTSR